MSCCVCGIDRSPLTKHLSFHTLPKNPEVRQKWLDILQKGNVKRLLVCGNHFRPEDYRESSMKPLLKPDAVPRTELVEIVRSGRSLNECQIESEYSEAPTDDHNYYCTKKTNTDVSKCEETPHGDQGPSYEEFGPVSPDDLGGLILADYDSKSKLTALTPLNDNFYDDSDRTTTNFGDDLQRASPDDNGNADDIRIDDSMRTQSEPSDNSEDEIKNILSENQILRETSNVKSPKTTNSRHSQRKLKPHQCPIPTQKRLYVGEFGVFRQADFKDETAWPRFVNLFMDMKRDAILLKRKNERLNDKVTMYKNMVAHLQKTARQWE